MHIKDIARIVEVNRCSVSECPACHYKARYDGDTQTECWLDENVRIGMHEKPLVSGSRCPLGSGFVILGFGGFETNKQEESMEDISVAEKEFDELIEMQKKRIQLGVKNETAAGSLSEQVFQEMETLRGLLQDRFAMSHPKGENVAKAVSRVAEALERIADRMPE